MKYLWHITESYAGVVLAIAAGLLVGALFMGAAGIAPLAAYTTLFCEGFGSVGCNSLPDLILVDVADPETGQVSYHMALLYGARGHAMALTLQRAVPLVLTGLAAMITFRAGLLSLGMDGQFAIGAVVAAFLGYWLPQQLHLTGADPGMAVRVLVLAMIMVAGALCGAVYSWLAGYMRVKLEINEIISTIVMNAIAVQFASYLINGPLRADASSIARTPRIAPVATLTPFSRSVFADVAWFSGSNLGPGMLIALAAVVALWVYLRFTTHGYEQRVMRGAWRFAEYAGIPVERVALRAMFISGALSGLAGVIEILGVERRMIDGYAQSGTGFDGVLVALLAGDTVLAIPVIAVLYAGLQVGAVNLQFAGVPRQIGNIIIAFVLLFMTVEGYLRTHLHRIREGQNA